MFLHNMAKNFCIMFNFFLHPIRSPVLREIQTVEVTVSSSNTPQNDVTPDTRPEVKKGVLCLDLTGHFLKFINIEHVSNYMHVWT